MLSEDYVDLYEWATQITLYFFSKKIYGMITVSHW